MLFFHQLQNKLKKKCINVFLNDNIFLQNYMSLANFIDKLPSEVHDSTDQKSKSNNVSHVQT